MVTEFRLSPVTMNANYLIIIFYNSLRLLRLYGPWTSLGRNTGVGSAQFGSAAQSFPTLCNPVDCSTQASLSSTNSRGLLKFMAIESVMPSNHPILCHRLLFCFQSFPASGSFPMSQLFASGGQSIGVSASISVLPMNTQD